MYPQSHDPPQQAPAVVPAINGKPGVLVVDDDHFVRAIVQIGLERDGFDVWLARGGREAVDLYREHRERIAAVLLDVQMPGLDGPQTLDALHRLNPNLRACFMSGDAGDYSPVELIQRGAAHVIDKPFRLENLAAILRQLLGCTAGDGFTPS